MEHIVQAVTIRWYNACADYAVSLARGLALTGRLVTVAGGTGTPAINRAREHGCPVIEYAGSSRTLSFAGRVESCRRFALENGVTLVDTHTGYDHLLWALALRGTGIPLVRTSGNQIPPGVHPASRLLMRKTAGVIVSCGTIRRYYADGFGIGPGVIPVINGGVDCDRFRPDAGGGVTKSSLGLPEDAFVFGILARYSPDKGHRYFFRAAGSLSRKRPDARFLVAGWRAQYTEQDMRKMAEEEGIADRCVFAGREKDTRGLIGCVDTGVVSSVRSETICRIAMEYMAMGVPVIGTDTNVIPEVVRHGETGLIVPAGDFLAMAAAMERMTSAPELAVRYSQNGRAAAVKEYSLEAFARKTLDAYGGFSI